jgi:hypothetical protein
VRNPFSVPPGAGLSPLNLVQRRAANRVIQLCEDQPGPDPYVESFNTRALNRLADCMEVTPAPNRRGMFYDLRACASGLWHPWNQRKDPLLERERELGYGEHYGRYEVSASTVNRFRRESDQKLQDVIQALEDSLGTPGEGPQRIRLTRLLVDNGHLPFGDPLKAVTSAAKLVDLAMQQPEAHRTSFTYAVGAFNSEHSDSIEEVAGKFEPFPPETWETVSQLCYASRSTLQWLTELSRDIQRFPVEDRQQLIELLTPLSSRWACGVLLTALQELPREQWKAHATTFCREATGNAPDFGLLDRSGNVIRPANPEQLRRNRANGESVMYPGEVAWAKDAIAKLQLHVKKPSLTASETVDEVLAEIELLRKGKPAEVDAGLYGSRAGTSELDHAVRVLSGARQADDYTDCFRDNRDVVTQYNGKEIKIGDLLAHVWHAAKTYSPKGVTAEERESLRADFKREIIARIAKCIEVDEPMEPGDPETTHRVCPLGVRRQLAEPLVDRIPNVKLRTQQEPREFMYVAKASFQTELEREQPDEYGVKQPLANRLLDWSSELKARAAEEYHYDPEAVTKLAKEITEYASIYAPVAGPTQPRGEWLKSNKEWRESNPGWVKQNPDWINLP